MLIAHDEPGPRLADLKGVYAPSVWLTICIVALLMLLALAALLKLAGAIVDFVEIAVTIMGLLCYQGKLNIYGVHTLICLAVHVTYIILSLLTIKHSESFKS